MHRVLTMGPREGWGRTVLYTALATSMITSSMFVTALAPNTLAVSVMRQTAGVTVSWFDWFVGFAPVGVTLIALMPLPALQDLSAGDSQRTRGAAVGGRAAARDGCDVAQGADAARPRVLRAGAVDRGHRLRRSRGDGDARRAADGDLRCRVVERRDRALAGVEHPGLVRDARHARRRAGGNEVPRLARAVARAHAPEFQPWA